MTPYYDEDGITIYHGDCLDVLSHLHDEADCADCGHPRDQHGSGSDSKCLATVGYDHSRGDMDICRCGAHAPGPWTDIVVTSPPYNMGLVPGGNGRGMYRPGASNKAGRFREGYDGGHDDAMPQDEYDAWQRAVLAECWRAARLAVFYNHRPRVEHGQLRVPLSFDYGPAVLRQIVVWDRGTGIDVNLRHFCTRQEWVLFFAKPDLRLVSHAASGMGDVWRLGMETSVTEHPAPFPVSLPARCIEATGPQSVLDPFMGSGSTLRAAKDAGIIGVGIEKSERYCEIAAQRLAQGVLDFDGAR